MAICIDLVIVGDGGALEFKAKTLVSAHDEEIQLGALVGCPEIAFSSLTFESRGELGKEKTLQEAPSLGLVSRSAMVRKPSKVCSIPLSAK